MFDVAVEIDELEHNPYCLKVTANTNENVLDKQVFERLIRTTQHLHAMLQQKRSIFKGKRTKEWVVAPWNEYRDATKSKLISYYRLCDVIDGSVKIKFANKYDAIEAVDGIAELLNQYAEKAKQELKQLVAEQQEQGMYTSTNS